MEISIKEIYPEVSCMERELSSGPRESRTKASSEIMSLKGKGSTHGLTEVLIWEMLCLGAKKAMASSYLRRRTPFTAVSGRTVSEMEKAG
jgi:hypothetical protein